MLRSALGRLRSLVGGADDDTHGDDDDRVEGSGAVHRDPAYNGRYEAEREIERIAEEAERAERDHPGHDSH